MGVVGAANTDFSFEMTVTRVAQATRITRPFEDDGWGTLVALGSRVEADLAAQDVRLTMGGEPTFVALDDREAAEWNTAALGAAKLALSETLLRRLRHRFAANGLVHHGQGKWYPGEPVPRWALGCHWRTDGRLLWHDKTLIADEARDYGFGAEDAHRFGLRLTERLNVDADGLGA